MYNAPVELSVQAGSAARRSSRQVPTARWVTTVGADGRRRLAMQWAVPGRTQPVRTTRAA